MVSSRSLVCASYVVAALALSACNAAPGAVAPVGAAGQAAGSVNLGGIAGATAGAGVATGATGTAATSTSGAIVATGASGISLTRDNADAYIDATLFAAKESGQLTTTVDANARETMVQNLIRNFPAMPAEAQAEVAKARATWTATSAKWGTMSDAEKLSFFSDIQQINNSVNTGTNTANASGGGGSSSGGCGDGQSFDDAMFNCAGVIVPGVPW